MKTTSERPLDPKPTEWDVPLFELPPDVPPPTEMERLAATVSDLFDAMIADLDDATLELLLVRLADEHDRRSK